MSACSKTKTESKGYDAWAHDHPSVNDMELGYKDISLIYTLGPVKVRVSSVAKSTLSVSMSKAADLRQLQSAEEA